MQLNRFSPFGASVKATKTSPSTIDLRPCQRIYLGESNARRLLKRSHLTKKARAGGSLDEPDPEEPLFTLHEEEAIKAASAAVTAPFQSHSQPTGYSVQCYATFAEDERKRQKAEVANKEKAVLLNSINSFRHAENLPPLRLSSTLAKHAEDYATMLFVEDSHATEPNTSTQNSVVVVMAPSGSRVARIVSPTRIGALTCGEMWYGGKYKRHHFPKEADEEREHPDDCICHLRMVFETMTDKGWQWIGIGRGEDGRWVVQLCE